MAAPNVANTLANVDLLRCTKRELGIIARASKRSPQGGDRDRPRGRAWDRPVPDPDGQCKVTIGGKTKARLGPGDFFGEVALLDGGPRTATVTAVSPVRLVGITGWVFRGLLMEHRRSPSRRWRPWPGVCVRSRRSPSSPPFGRRP